MRSAMLQMAMMALLADPGPRPMVIRQYPDPDLDLYRPPHAPAPPPKRDDVQIITPGYISAPASERRFRPENDMDRANLAAAEAKRARRAAKRKEKSK